MKKLLFIMLLAGVPMAMNAQTPNQNRINEQKIYDAFNSGNFNELDKYITKDARLWECPPLTNG